MPITPQQIQNAKQVQDAAAQDPNSTVRLVAGPGTGKSFVIEGRVHWLLATQNIPAQNIIAVSFTRAAAKDLKERITTHCLQNNQPTVAQIRVSTLHSMALTILRQTGNLNFYPTDPVIMDDWELKHIFDAEFATVMAPTGQTPTRCEKIRRDHEAFWSTGAWNPPNLPQLPNPITNPERASFNTFHGTRTQCYACVLPGELIRKCVDQIRAGLIDPIAVLGVEHLIVDEVQDLNYCDFEFIDLLIQRGVNVFVSGDDDQSVYSFRYAFPQGIQNFPIQYPGSTNHVLNDCFRCTPAVLNAATNTLNIFPAPGRIPKQLTSVYLNSVPQNPGVFIANTFQNPNREASYIAASCQSLINGGLSAKDIMILIGNKGAQLTPITQALDALNLAYDANQRDSFKQSNHGRFLLGLLRIFANTNDYVAHRVILGTPNGVGIGTCHGIATRVVQNNLNFRDLFHNAQVPQGFTGRMQAAINRGRNNLTTIQGWALADTLNIRANDVDQILLSNFGQNEVNEWRTFIASFPLDMTLEELKDYLETDSQEVKDSIINNLLLRLNLGQNPAQNPLDKIKIMSFHSSKGLSAKVVFIPGLEETIFPNTFSIQVPGLVLESARLFYVALTRAKAACIISHCRRRNVNGLQTQMTPSRFCVATGAVFAQQNSPSLSQNEINAINTSIQNL